MTTSRTSRTRRSKNTPTATPGTVVAYVRVSTAEQAVSGLGLEAQRATIADYAARKGLTIVAEHSDEGISAKSLRNRPGALSAIEAVRTRQAQGVLVAKLDRLSRSVPDAGTLMEQARTEGWALHFADLDIDTGTPAGEMAANVIIAASQYERRLIAQRTKDALAVKRARGERLGAVPALSMEVTRRILSERAAGRTFQAVADGLMADGIPTSRGKTTWYPATIKAVCEADHTAELRAELAPA
jgi:DNA invertase Pin-like site-specific DNA recombinase